MSNLGFEPGWVGSTTRNLTSWAKPTLQFIFIYELAGNNILETEGVKWNSTLGCMFLLNLYGRLGFYFRYARNGKGIVPFQKTTAFLFSCDVQLGLS
jgi:hypothetical protein